MLIVYYILVFGILLLVSGSVIWALWWAIRGGQFSDFRRDAASIFDEDEPIGEITDAFPDARTGARRSQSLESIVNSD